MEPQAVFGHVLIYGIMWIIIYADNRRGIHRHWKFALFMGTFFLFVSLMLSGYLYAGFREIWVSAFSWPPLVGYILAKYTREEMETYATIKFIQSQLNALQEIIDIPYSDPGEKTVAKQRWVYLRSLLAQFEGV